MKVYTLLIKIFKTLYVRYKNGQIFHFDYSTDNRMNLFSGVGIVFPSGGDISCHALFSSILQKSFN